MNAQRVNFYQEIYRPRFDPLAARTILMGAGAMLILLLIVTGILRWRLAVERNAVLALENEKNRLVTRVTDLSTRHPARPPSQELASQIERMEKEKHRKNRMLAVLNKTGIGNAKRVTPLLLAMAAAGTKGVWLTGIGVFERQGRQLVIEGMAQNANPERIPQMVQDLARNEVLAGIPFRHFQVMEEEGRPGTLRFSLKSADLELDRPWEEKKDGDKSPAVLQKARQGAEEARADMQKAADIGKMLTGTGKGDGK
ncbi:MAG: hypothetical protein HQM03_14235 [Magnetococcales bacterium]|nr:hypothetical protein [Magnetococcales bacterium]